MLYQYKQHPKKCCSLYSVDNEVHTQYLLVRLLQLQKYSFDNVDTLYLIDFCFLETTS